MKLAILGGSFNPVHKGHVALAQSVIDLLPYDKVLFIPASVPPHKRDHDMAQAKDRLEMIHLALEDKPWAMISDCELKRKGPSYTVDTLEYIHKEYQLDEKPGLVMGDDWIDGFYCWKNVEEIVELSHLIVARRETQWEDFPFPCTFLDNPVLTVSSTVIREKCLKGEGISSFVPEKVADYISIHGLYKTN